MEQSLFDLESENTIQDFEQTVQALKTLRLHVVKEEHYIHEQIKKTLTEHGLEYTHEYYLGPRNRVDFLTQGGTAVEVKKGRPNKTSLLKQIERYLSFDNVHSLVVIVEKGMDFPEEVNGKKVLLISLNRLWGFIS